ncbi:MAG: ATP:cob(I)alamin adenosyltransferase [Opitutales bacterium]
MAGSIVTRKGDSGTTRLLFGEQVFKGHPRVCVYGALDEAGALLTAARAQLAQTWAETLKSRQRLLIQLSAELACLPAHWPALEAKGKLVSSEDLASLDQACAALEGPELAFDEWIVDLPPGPALVDVARTVVRRAEAQLWAQLAKEVRPETKACLNRFSDYLWLFARAAARASAT